MTIQDAYNDPILYRLRSGKGDDAYIKIDQTDIVRNNTILLREIPDKFQGLRVSDSNNNTLSIVDSGIPDSTKVVVDWTNGVLTFADVFNGQTFTISYYGRGNIFMPSSKVYTATDGYGNITETLKTLTDTAVTSKQDVDSAIANANTSADYAKGIRDNFGHKGNYSPSVAYKNGNIVAYGGTNYICIKDTTAGIDPLNGTYWTVISPQATINKQTWTATANQTVFTITNGSYVPNQGNIEVIVGSVPQITGIGFTETNTTTITLSEGVPAGTIVFARWFEGSMSITKGHNNSHYLNGQDELDLTKLRNYQEQVSSPINVLFGVNDYRTDFTYIGGQVATETVSDSKGNVIGKTTYTYVNNNLDTSVLVTNGQTITSKYTYDSNGNLLSIVNTKS
jgi:YD repeat-containing protein